MDMAYLSPQSRPMSSLAQLPDLASLGELVATPLSKNALRPASRTSGAVQLPPAHKSAREVGVENESPITGLRSPHKRPKSAPALASSFGQISPEEGGGGDMATRAKSPSVMRPHPASLLGRKSPPGPTAPLLALSRSRCYEGPSQLPEPPVSVLPRASSPPVCTIAHSEPMSPLRALELAERVHPERPMPRLFDDDDDDDDETDVDDCASAARRPVLSSRLVHLGSTLMSRLPALSDVDDADEYVADAEAIGLFKEGSL